MKYDLTFRINYDINNYRVPGIKFIRTISGLGLKEAKDIHDSMMDTRSTVTMRLNEAQVARFAVERELANQTDTFPVLVYSLTSVKPDHIIDVSDRL